MKNRFLKYALAISLAGFTAGCSDFLDIDPYGSSATWETQEDVDDAIAALYNFTVTESVSTRGLMWLECANDNMVPGRPRANADQIKMFRMTPTNSEDAKTVWGHMYQNNAKANNIIKLVPDIEGLSDTYRNKALGIGYFFRGFSMLWIAPYYGDNGPNGGIPIVLDTTDPASIDSPRPESVLMNYDQIIEDMYTAGELLPLLSQLDTRDYGYPHKAAAWAYGARAALYAAQYDATYYDIVIDFCNRIDALTGSDKRALYTTGSTPYANLWRSENNFSSEYIFSMLGNANEGPKFHGVSFQNGGWGEFNCWGYFMPTLELAESFEAGDQRREATILMPGESMQFVSNDLLYGGISAGGFDATYISSTSGMAFRKFMSPYEDKSKAGDEYRDDGNNMSTKMSVSLMRYADVMLMKAEALIWKNGEGNGEAAALLNQIRARAGLPQNSNATKAELKRERRSELAFEFQPSRFVDVVRWGDAEELFSQKTYGIVSDWDKDNKIVVIDPEPVELYSQRTFRPGVNHVFPIPSEALDGSTNLVQNVGY